MAATTERAPEGETDGSFALSAADTAGARLANAAGRLSVGLGDSEGVGVARIADVAVGGGSGLMLEACVDSAAGAAVSFGSGFGVAAIVGLGVRATVGLGVAAIVGLGVGLVVGVGLGFGVGPAPTSLMDKVTFEIVM